MRWYIWRVVLAQIATLQEIETHWSLNDLADAHEALDIQAETQERELAQMRKQGANRDR